jgi:hypothetical protein
VEGISGERTNRLRLLVLAEALTEEQLSIYDLLMQPSPELTDTERSQVKWVTESLLEALKREKPDELPKKFTRELYVEKVRRRLPARVRELLIRRTEHLRPSRLIRLSDDWKASVPQTQTARTDTLIHVDRLQRGEGISSLSLSRKPGGSEAVERAEKCRWVRWDPPVYMVNCALAPGSFVATPVSILTLLVMLPSVLSEIV